MPDLILLRVPLRQELGGEQALGQVVDPPIALAPGERQHPRLGERLEDRPDLVRRPPVPLDGGPWLDIGRGQGPARADPLEQLLHEGRVLVERGVAVRRLMPVPV